MYMKENENILDAFFYLRQEDLLDELNEDKRCLKNALKKVCIKDLQKSINKLPNEYDNVKNEIYDYIDTIIANYEIKRAYYDKKYYKQGFNDAVMINCYCKEKK